jgi:hypothetical protein
MREGHKEAEKFCNACFKAGKDKSLYTSHFPRSTPGPNGIVVCPTILAASCKYCGKSGHWANEKHCAAMREDAKRNQMFERVDRRGYSNATATNASKPLAKDVKQVSSRYAALMESDDDSDCDEKLVGKKRSAAASVAVPKPVTPVEAVLPKAGVSWASMAAAPAKPVENTGTTIYYSSKAVSEYVPLTDKELLAMSILAERRTVVRRSWLSDSEDEEEEEQDYVDNSAW